MVTFCEFAPEDVACQREEDLVPRQAEEEDTPE
eukprot:CAMPEP_0170465864 /NCGR_PEP_ID=MMETSP0123-20130129/10042_1 /TAXON_ID=182087 /ORGANISM="Favella ehrenbergii, Strain Fehren 1" /LENGTH=32 /DNA_ID= /DNA_START= /DNA_END= /DNA_ORIENTATION=